MDKVPSILQGTGFAQVSSTTQANCNAKLWCPLLQTTKDYTFNGTTVTYYYYSACCKGRQGWRLIADPAAGIPTCRLGTPASKCRRYEWNQKLEEDLGIQVNGDTPAVTNAWNNGGGLPDPWVYDFKVFPATHTMDGVNYGGQKFGNDVCVCPADSPFCVKWTSDYKKCLWCKDVGPTKCHHQSTDVKVGLHFFKIHTVDLKSSLLAFQTWIKLQWYDTRLAWDYQCYGGLEAIAVQARDGDLENTRIWTPDIELVNADQLMWGGEIGPRLAKVYGCWDRSPSRGGCGYVYWKRPAVMKALCKYGGLAKFPLDVLYCELEMSAWVLTGNHQDFLFIDEGVSWSSADGGPPSPNMANDIAGIVGGSAFQDYRIKSSRARRDICIYPCCADPYTTLIWELNFERSNYFYQLKLFIPSILITAISFTSFWLDPQVGERINFGITVILAIVANDVTAIEMMPVCNATLLMGYVSLTCFLFAVITLIETFIVHNLYFRTDRDWIEAFTPTGMNKFVDMFTRWIKSLFRKTKPASLPPSLEIQQLPVSGPEGKAGLLRSQLYKETFFALDRNHSGELEVSEAHLFAKAVLGKDMDDTTVDDILHHFDTNGNGRLGYDEFVVFCETCLKDKNNMKILTKLLRGYVRAVDREYDAILEMWRTRAITVDTISRFAVPPGYVLGLAMCLTLTQDELEGQMETDSLGKQWTVKTYGFWPMVVIIILYAMYNAYFKCGPKPKEKIEAAALDQDPDRVAQACVDLEEEVAARGGEPATVSFL